MASTLEREPPAQQDNIWSRIQKELNAGILKLHSLLSLLSFLTGIIAANLTYSANQALAITYVIEGVVAAAGLYAFGVLLSPLFAI